MIHIIVSCNALQCSVLHRNNCTEFGIADTCGSCSSGYIGTVGPSNINDCQSSAPLCDTVNCALLYRSECIDTQICGACLSGYHLVSVANNTACARM